MSTDLQTQMAIGIGILIVLLVLGLIARHLVKRDEARGVPERPSPAAEFMREFRPWEGTCPGCGAGEDEWCNPGCKYIDQTDYR